MSSSSLIRVTGGEIIGPRGSVLSQLDFALEAGEALAILGPVCSGKSALLRAITGQRDAPGFRRTGSWSAFGEALPSTTLDARVRWLPQARYRQHHRLESFSRPPAVANWRDALIDGPELFCLDEPDEDNAPLEPIVLEIEQCRKAGGTLALVTHHLGFARQVATKVLFVGAGKQREFSEAEAFFNRPSSEQARRYIDTGNCSWPGGHIPLPSHFYWVIPGSVGAMAYPGLDRDQDEDLASLVEAGVSFIVSLTKTPVNNRVLRSFGIECRHFPIQDMGAPDSAATAGLCADIERRMKRKQGIVIHCQGGLGRAGTIAACILCWLGLNAEMAIGRVRKSCAGAIQTEGQARFVELFDQQYGGSGHID